MLLAAVALMAERVGTGRQLARSSTPSEPVRPPSETIRRAVWFPIAVGLYVIRSEKPESELAAEAGIDLS